MNCRFPRPNASARMFCFPWAGGGASFYTSWGRDITEELEVHALCLPGRENRFKDPCNYCLQDVVDEIVKTIHEDFCDKPFIFYGHSMGASLALFVALEMKRLHNKQPEHMFLSGSLAPNSPHKKERMLQIKNLPKDEFIEKLRQLGGTPPEILDNPEIMDLFYPALFADFSMVAEMCIELSPEEEPPLSCPIDFFDGENDVDHDIDAWRKVTKGVFKFQTMPGGHFFLKEPAENTRNLINIIDQRFSGYHDIV